MLETSNLVGSFLFIIVSVLVLISDNLVSLSHIIKQYIKELNLCFIHNMNRYISNVC